MDWFDRAADQLEKDLDDGVIDHQEFGQEMAHLRAELRDAAEDAAEEAYRAEMGLMD